LARVYHAPKEETASAFIDIGVIEDLHIVGSGLRYVRDWTHNNGGFPAQLEDTRLQVLRRLAGNDTTDSVAASELPDSIYIYV
jgi:hypothetical protein